ncbi:hypothetical protein D3C76_692230 [compost metagenome]
MLPNDPIYYRLAEIGKRWKDTGTPPNAQEMNDIRDIMFKHANIMMDVVMLNNMSMAAHVANDHDWQHRILAASQEFAMTSVLPLSWLTEYEQREADPRLSDYPPTGTKEDNNAEGAD